MEIAIVAVIGVVVFGVIGATFLYASRRSPRGRGSGLLVWTGIVGAIYFGIFLFWIALLTEGLVTADSPWLWVGLMGPLAVWSVVAAVDALTRPGSRATPSARRTL